MIRQCRRFLLVQLLLTAGAFAEKPVWPLPGGLPADLSAHENFVQPTASGEPDSALFGCIRNDGYRFHEAIDIAPVLPRKRGEATDPIVAIHGGIVRHINKVSGNSSYGRYVVIEHGGLDLVIFSLYSHLASVDPAIEVGKVVRAGTVIGIMGRSAGGYTIPRSRSHLHLEIGLRLSDSFEDWYRRQAFKSPNDHGNFNGMNLVGLDPLDYFAAYESGRIKSPLSYLGQLPPAAMVHIKTKVTPDFAVRYPELFIDGCPESERAGWEILFSAWGLPLSFKPLRESELLGVSREGQISVVGVDRSALSEFGCRNLIEERAGKVSLGTTGKTTMELLFIRDLLAE